MVNIPTVFTEICAHIEEHITRDNIDTVNKKLKMLPSSDQSLLYSILSLESLHYIIKHREQIVLIESIIEDMMWFYYSQQKWTDHLLDQIIDEYEAKPTVGLASIIVSQLKDDHISIKQFELISTIFHDKEIKRQLYFWKVRRKLESGEAFSRGEIEKVLEMRGYEYLEKAIKEELIDPAHKAFFIKPSTGEKNRKQKEMLYQAAKKMTNYE